MTKTDTEREKHTCIIRITVYHWKLLKPNIELF